MAESAAKRLKVDMPSPSTSGEGLLIGTHNGHFHADEALAVHMLRRLPAYASSRLVRTRDAARLAECHTVVDVGGEYEPTRHRYDHHQRGFTTTFPGRPTKLSSAGLVFMHFGKEIIARRLLQHKQEANSNTTSTAADTDINEDAPEVTLLWNKLYESFVEALDAHDNGIDAYDPSLIAAAGAHKRFQDGGFTLGAMVGRLNPNWNDPPAATPAEAQAREDDKFLRASARIGEEFDRDLDYYATAWLPARAIVQEAFAKRHEHDPQGRVLVLDGQAVPWKDHLYSLEAGHPSVLYVLYAEKANDPSAKWRVQCVPVSKDSFQSRKPLPEAWRGFRDQELDRIAGVDGCVFVHAAGFIGGNKTFEGAKAMVAKALDM